MKDSQHIFCTSCRQHSFLCPCWYHGRFVVECMVIGRPHHHIAVDLNYLSTERPVGTMQIRKRTAVVNDAIKYTGDLNGLITWCSQQDDFTGFYVMKNLTIRVITTNSEEFNVEINDWIRVDDTGKLDRIRASVFEATWEVVM